ncbi:MAG TPA: cytochrome P460 family protein [Candidatus Limnocylindria bacterium]|nr:cytochrome P460 family protein [Candidatus Limnocylindria bacterium]
MWRRLSAVLAASLLSVVSCAAPAGKGPAAIPTATSGPTAGAQPCASGGLAISTIAAPSATAAPTVGAPTTTSAPAATAAAPTATPRPAPTTDRVGFPEGYQTAFKFLYVYDRLDAKSISYICGNDAAASAKQGQPFPYGSVVVFESWRPKEDASGNTIKDTAGHLIRSTLNAIFVMRKEPGFGEAYQQFRTGEWEYVAYRPDKSFQTPPQLTATCSSCHQASNKDRDWTFRAWELPFTPTHYAAAPLPSVNEISLNRMAFFPNAITVAAGTTVKWINSQVDKIDHTVASADGSISSGPLKPGDSFSFTFTKPGTYQYFCSVHPDQMKARVEVK